MSDQTTEPERDEIGIANVSHAHETMSRDEQIRWCALQIAHANTPSFATQVVHEPPNVLKRAEIYEAYLRGTEIPEWVAPKESNDE